MVTFVHRPVLIAAALAIVVGIDVSAGFAQTQVRVVRDRSTIWRRDARLTATTVRSGTLLDVVGRDGDWYVVVIPAERGGNGETGLIAVALVEPVAAAPALRRAAPPQSAPPRSSAQAPVRPLRSERPTAGRSVAVYGFGDFSEGVWLAHRSFAALFGRSDAPMFGGGVRVDFRTWYVEGMVERFEKTGQRVFVSDGSVFPLGISDTVRVVPLSATIGYRREGRRVTPYVGGGAGRYLYKETSEFADPSENTDEGFTSYHAVGGVEFAGGPWVKPAVEVQFTTVPKALGSSGASAAFDEHNLGGVQVRVKILIGR